MRTLRILGLLTVCACWACGDEGQTAEKAPTHTRASALVAEPTPAELAAQASAALAIGDQSKELKDRYTEARKRQRQRDREVAGARVAELRAERKEAKERAGFDQLLTEAEGELSRVEQQEAQEPAVTP